jgi:hypothetical protein
MKKRNSADEKPADGWWAATGLPVGSLSHECGKVLEEFHRFASADARAAFAGRWLQTLASRLENTWPVMYELLAIIRDRDLYRSEHFLESGQVFASFEDYFVREIGQPFEVWAKLEKAYQFVSRNRPGLFGATLSQVAAEVKADEDQQRGAGGNNNPTGTNQYTRLATEVAAARQGQRSPDDPNGRVVNHNNVIVDQSTPKAPLGNSRQKALRKLRQEAEKDEADPRVQDIYRRVLAEEISPHRGMVEAGFRKVKTPGEWLDHWWERATSGERKAFLVRQGVCQ